MVTADYQSWLLVFVIFFWLAMIMVASFVEQCLFGRNDVK